MQVSRRAMLGGSALIAAAGLLPLRAWADDHSGTDLTADQALAALRAGNRKFVAATRPDYPIHNERRLEIAQGQTPFAVILGCSDSRVGPEQIFSAGLGELFVVRNAGNTAATAQSLGSVEYAVAQLGVPLILVLGHSKCGAVKAATGVVQNNDRFPGSIGGLIEPIVPAALAVRGQSGDAVENAVRENVRRVAARLRSAEQPILYPPQRAGKVKVAGAVYDLETGVVDFFDLPPAA